MVTLLAAYGLGYTGLRLGRMVPADRFFALFLSLLTGLTIGQQVGLSVHNISATLSLI